MIKKLNSMRVLEAQGVRYEVLSFPDTIQAAVGVAAYYGLPPAQVYKTLVVVLSQGKPALVLIAGETTGAGVGREETPHGYAERSRSVDRFKGRWDFCTGVVVSWFPRLH
jgi:hypothetical protein